MKIPDEYLGDGVYASFDGYQIWLDLRQESDCQIALEPEVMKNLIKYKEKIDKAFEELQNPQT